MVVVWWIFTTENCKMLLIMVIVILQLHYLH